MKLSPAEIIGSYLMDYRAVQSIRRPEYRIKNRDFGPNTIREDPAKNSH